MSLSRLAGSLALCLLAVPAPAPAAEPLGDATLDEARALRDRALTDDTAYDLVRSLTTEVEPRLAGSVATPADGLEAEVVQVASLDDLKAQPRERIEGRIVYFDARMERTRDGSGYGRSVPPRSSGAAEAARLGAVAMLMRPAGTSSSRTPHTGAQRWSTGIPPIPAFALSNPDADLLDLQLASGRAVRLRLASTSRWDGEAQSANVIGEIPGGTRRNEIVLLGAHVLGLESDLGAFRPYGFQARVAPGQLAVARRIHSVLEPLGIAWLGTEASGGADVGQLRRLGVPVMDLETDAAPYFDLHHTANDTFDKVDPELLRLNVAAVTAIACLAAEVEGGFGRLPVAPPADAATP